MKLTIESIELSQAKSASAFKERQNEQRRSNHARQNASKHPMRDRKRQEQLKKIKMSRSMIQVIRGMCKSS